MVEKIGVAKIGKDWKVFAKNCKDWQKVGKYLQRIAKNCKDWQKVGKDLQRLAKGWERQRSPDDG